MSGGDSSSGWQLTESDPGVFSELLKTLQVPFIVDDLYSLDPEFIAGLQPLHALIFLFKWIPSMNGAAARAGEDDPDFQGFFAHQVVNNACATLAVINALGNIPGLSAGPQLSELLAFATSLDPETRGLVITSCDWLREAHNALSPPSAISLDGLGLPKTAEDAYHFVVYLPVMGCLYELDGLKQCAVKHGPYEEAGEGWVAKAREVIESRIATYPTDALEFSLLAIHSDPLPSLQTQLSTLQSDGQGDSAEAIDVISKIANEENKRSIWEFENSIRRHNHVGLMHALLDALAKAGRLEEAKRGARRIMHERLESTKKKGHE